MIGLVEKLLTARYGRPGIEPSGDVKDCRWQEVGERSVLHKGLSWDAALRQQYGPLEELYGDARGGSIMGGSLKIALIRGPDTFDLYLIDELQSQPEVLRASTHDSAVCFFMDAANVWFYGVKDAQLFSYDAESDELDCMGPLEQAMAALLEEWEHAKP